MPTTTLFQRRLFAAFCSGIVGCALFGVTTEIATAAGTIIDSKGFESPYAVGQLQGQFGWLPEGTGGSSATVQNAIAQSGSQAVLVTRAANSNRHWAVPVSGFPTQRFVAIDWDMRVSPPSDLTAVGPFLGVDSYADVDYFGVLGALGVNATTGGVMYQQGGSGVLLTSTTSVSLNQWHHFRIVLDYSTHSYSGYVNDNLAATSGFVDHDATLNPLNYFSDADIAAFAADADATSQGLTASAIFDNFLVRDGLLGDYDIDGDVDSADYTVWKAKFGTTVAVAGNNADGNKNGVVDVADYAIWRDNLGSSLFGAPGSGAAISVPEPSAFVILLIGLSSFGWYARRRHA